MPLIGKILPIDRDGVVSWIRWETPTRVAVYTDQSCESSQFVRYLNKYERAFIIAGYEAGLQAATTLL